MALAVALLLASGCEARAEPAAELPGPARIVVTTAVPLDAQRLADVLRAYLDGAGVVVQPAAVAAVGGVHQQLDEARRVGVAARATTVVRVERDASEASPGGLEIQLIDLTTDEIVSATVASPSREEDRYRALALKLQAILRARWSAGRAGAGAEADLAAGSTRADVTASPLSDRATSALGLDVGLALVSFPIAGPLLQGLDVRARWLPSPRLAVTLGAALLGPTSASNGDVDATAHIVPFRATAMARLTRGRAALFAGPAAELSLLRVAATSATTPVRSVHHAMLALGAEADGRLALAGPLWLFARAATLGILNGQRYQAAGSPLIDTSRFELTGTVGVAAAIP